MKDLTLTPASLAGFTKVVNHLLFGKIEEPIFNGKHLPLNVHLVNFIPENANFLKMNHNFFAYVDTFNQFIDDFLTSDVNKDANSKNRVFEEHPAAKYFEEFLKGSLYHNDLVSYQKMSFEGLKILFINEEQDCVEFLSYSTLNFIEIVKFIDYGQKTISEENYLNILNHLDTVILRQKMIFTS